MKTLIIGFFLSIAMFTAPLFSADYYNQDEWIIPTGLNAGITFNTACYNECDDNIGSLGLNLSYRASVSIAAYLTLSDNFINTDSNVFQADAGLNFYIIPENKFQPLVTAGLSIYNFTEDNNFKSIFAGIGGEYVINEKMTVPFKVSYSKNFDYSELDTINFSLGFNYYF